MKKAGLTILKYLAVVFAILVLGAGTSHEAGFIDGITFAASGALFGALAGVCGWAVWKYDDEEEVEA